MVLFSIFVVIGGLLETSVAFYSFTGSRDVFPVHPSDSTFLNRIKLFPLSRQLWENNGFGAAHTNERVESRSGTAYVCWKDNKDDCLETWEKVTREVSFTDVSLGDEQMDGFSNIVTNGSTGAVVGGSCAGMVCLCLLIYILYRLCRDDTRVTPVAV